MASTTIGGIRVDLQLNGAAFIRDIAVMELRQAH
jgi:hypothetical protein